MGSQNSKTKSVHLERQPDQEPNVERFSVVVTENLARRLSKDSKPSHKSENSSPKNSSESSTLQEEIQLSPSLKNQIDEMNQIRTLELEEEAKSNLNFILAGFSPLFSYFYFR
eukprot:Sdes_comp18092_c1_seq4m7517